MVKTCNGYKLLFLKKNDVLTVKNVIKFVKNNTLRNEKKYFRDSSNSLSLINSIGKWGNYYLLMYKKKDLVGISRLRVYGIKKMDISFLVSVKNRREGIGSVLLKAATEIVHSLGDVAICMVAKENKKSIGVFQKSDYFKLQKENSEVVFYESK